MKIRPNTAWRRMSHLQMWYFICQRAPRCPTGCRWKAPPSLHDSKPWPTCMTVHSLLFVGCTEHIQFRMALETEACSQTCARRATWVIRDCVLADVLSLAEVASAKSRTWNSSGFLGTTNIPTTLIKTSVLKCYNSRNSKSKTFILISICNMNFIILIAFKTIIQCH